VALAAFTIGDPMLRSSPAATGITAAGAPAAKTAGAACAPVPPAPTPLPNPPGFVRYRYMGIRCSGKISFDRESMGFRRRRSQTHRVRRASGGQQSATERQAFHPHGPDLALKL
jgi:hypothetical protein